MSHSRKKKNESPPNENIPSIDVDDATYIDGQAHFLFTSDLKNIPGTTPHSPILPETDYIKNDMKQSLFSKQKEISNFKKKHQKSINAVKQRLNFLDANDPIKVNFDKKQWENENIEHSKFLNIIEQRAKVAIEKSMAPEWKTNDESAEYFFGNPGHVPNTKSKHEEKTQDTFVLGEDFFYDAIKIHEWLRNLDQNKKDLSEKLVQSYMTMFLLKPSNIEVSQNDIASSLNNKLEAYWTSSKNTDDIKNFLSCNITAENIFMLCLEYIEKAIKHLTLKLENEKKSGKISTAREDELQNKINMLTQHKNNIIEIFSKIPFFDNRRTESFYDKARQEMKEAAIEQAKKFSLNTPTAKNQLTEGVAHIDDVFKSFQDIQIAGQPRRAPDDENKPDATADNKKHTIFTIKPN